MKLLLDHNLSYRLVADLITLYPGSQHLRQINMTTADDVVVWEYAIKQGMAIVSKDSDFYHRSMLLGQPPKVVWIRLGNCSTAEISKLLHARHAELVEFDQDNAATFVILSKKNSESQ